jgi:hypothetical protein
VFSVYGLPQLTVHSEDNKIINNSNEVSNFFNNLFATVAEKIGENVVYDPSNHPSITAMHENNSIELNEFYTIILMHSSYTRMI